MHLVDPFSYPDWNTRLLAAPQASIFHTTNWLRVLQASYGYRPYYMADFSGKHLTTLLPLMEVKSWLTGSRGIALPFSDYCEPIRDDSLATVDGLAPVFKLARQRHWKFVEIRGGETWFKGVSPYTSYVHPRLALHGDTDKIFSRLRRNYRTKIRKAKHHDLTVTMRTDPDAMAAYYRLHCLTRQGHGLPPPTNTLFPPYSGPPH